VCYATGLPQAVRQQTIMILQGSGTLEGRGEIWRDDGVDSCITDLVPGTSIDIPVGTAFQYRNVSDQELRFICVAMPP
jgi:mannose-6-phosphate isomerase-like protein (cupin superfamily)